MAEKRPNLTKCGRKEARKSFMAIYIYGKFSLLRSFFCFLKQQSQQIWIKTNIFQMFLFPNFLLYLISVHYGLEVAEMFCNWPNF
jgi:ribosomal protein S19